MRQYKSRRTDNCVVYLLTCMSNEKIYIGQTWHELHARMGKDGCNYSNSIYLYSAIQKYGAENFEYGILGQFATQEEADEFEKESIIKYNSLNPEIGYNLKEGGSAGRHTENTRKKIAETQKARAAEWSDGEKAQRSASVSGYWQGKERGPQSEERKLQKSKEMIDFHTNNDHPMLGKHHSEETKAKISASNMGKIIPKESVEKRAAARRMPKEREDEIIKLYLDGEALLDIVDKIDTSTKIIYKVLKRNNIEKRR